VSGPTADVGDRGLHRRPGGTHQVHEGREEGPLQRPPGETLPETGGIVLGGVVEAWVDRTNSWLKSGLSARTGAHTAGALPGPCVRQANKAVFPAQGVVSVEEDGWIPEP
jgi:hypothetical protein